MVVALDEEQGNEYQLRKRSGNASMGFGPVQTTLTALDCPGLFMSTSLSSPISGPEYIPQSQADAPPAPIRPARTRIDSIDLLRGIVMVIMMLDHTRDFVHSGGLTLDPEDLTRTTPILFFTRWITHFCAPVFMFASGIGAFLLAQRSPEQISRFLWTRGLWLIILEVVLMRVAFYFSFNLQYPVLLVVLWALGCSMVALALLSKLPLRVLSV